MTDDKQGQFRREFPVFVMEWALRRYGIKSLADMFVLDLHGSIQKHYQASIRVRLFGRFMGVVDPILPPPTLSFFLDAVRQFDHRAYRHKTFSRLSLPKGQVVPPDMQRSVLQTGGSDSDGGVERQCTR